jgi:polysaccharide deacetylase 2 family uncharacterized protein YibQ
VKFPNFGFWRKKKDADDEAFDDEGSFDDEADEIAAAAASRSARADGGQKKPAGAASDSGSESEDMADDVAARILASLPQVGDDLTDPEPAARQTAAGGGPGDRQDDDDAPPGEGAADETAAGQADDPHRAGAGDDDPVFDDDDNDDADGDPAARPGKRRLIALAAAATVAVAALGGGAWWWLGADGSSGGAHAVSGPRVELMLPPPPGAGRGGLAPPSPGVTETAESLMGSAARPVNGAPAGTPPDASAQPGAVAAAGASDAAPAARETGAPAAMAAAAPAASAAEAVSAAPAAMPSALPAALPAGLANGAGAPGASLNTLAATLQGPGAGLVVPPVNVALLQALPQAAPAGPLPPAPEAGLFEPGPGGPLPKADGRRTPLQVYARPPAATQGPRIAIVLGGMGLSGFLTRHTIEAMPADVTIALDAYGRDIAALGLMARAQGHETLIVAPLESNDYPYADPGPLGWQVGQAPEENIRRLHTVLSRFAGYAGVQIDLASRVADQSGALRPIAQILKTRGLMVFHPGGAQGAGAVVLKELRLPAAAADVVIDEQPTDAAIVQRLADLEARARANPAVGAVGFARPYPATLLRLSPWLGTLAAKGITLVPVSALARDGAS